MERLRIGVIGAGNMGRNHIRILCSEKAAFEFVGFYDVDEVQSRKIAKQFGVRNYPSAEALMEDIQAVTIAVPSSLHLEVALEVAARGLHALIEKPLALTFKDAQKISDAFAGTGKILSVGHVERYNPVVDELRKILQMEKILAMEVRRYSPFNGRIIDADVVQDLMIHDIDLVCGVLIQSELCGISAVGRTIRSGKLDYVQSLLTFQNGLVAGLGASRVTENKVREIVVHTEQSYILADLLSRSLSVTRNTNLVIGQGHESAYRQDSVTQRIFVPMVEPLRAELLDFRNCILEGREPPANSASACQAISISEEIARQAMGTPICASRRISL